MEEFNYGLLQPKKQQRRRRRQIPHFIHHWSCGELAKARFTIHFVFVDLLLFSFFADWLLNICDAARKTMIPLRERSIPKNKCGFARMLRVRLICQNQGQKDKQMIFCDFIGQFKIMFKVVKKNCNFPVKKEVRMFQFFHYWFCK